MNWTMSGASFLVLYAFSLFRQREDQRDFDDFKKQSERDFRTGNSLETL
jgi:hypothetical protein